MMSAAFAALFAGHWVGDHWAQTNHQAQTKGQRDTEGRRACAFASRVGRDLKPGIDAREQLER